MLQKPKYYRTNSTNLLSFLGNGGWSWSIRCRMWLVVVRSLYVRNVVWWDALLCRVIGRNVWKDYESWSKFQVSIHLRFVSSRYFCFIRSLWMLLCAWWNSMWIDVLHEKVRAIEQLIGKLWINASIQQAESRVLWIRNNRNFRYVGSNLTCSILPFDIWDQSRNRTNVKQTCESVTM